MMFCYFVKDREDRVVVEEFTPPAHDYMVLTDGEEGWYGAHVNFPMHDELFPLGIYVIPELKENVVVDFEKKGLVKHIYH
jgi:hypothetical protein